MDSVNHPAQIILSRNKIALVDQQVFNDVNQYKWSAQKVGRVWYAVRSVKKKTIYMHRFLLDAPEGMEVDHIDGDGLNNCLSNIRLATHSQNAQNVRCSSGNSGYRGVRWHKRDSIWQVRIGVEGKDIHVGYSHDLQEAARMYDEAAIKYHGEFATLNFGDVT